MISLLGIGYLSSVGHNAVFIFCVSDAHNFSDNRPSVCDYGYGAFGEVARFTLCLLQKIKSAQSLPLVEKCEDFKLPKHSQFAPFEKKDFLAESRIAWSVLEMMGSVYFRNEFRKNARKFLEELTKAVLSIAAARSDVGHGLRCFCPNFVVGGTTMPFSFVCPAPRWFHRVDMGPWLNCASQWG